MDTPGFNSKTLSWDTSPYPEAPTKNWFGPVSKGLNVASGLLQAAGLFDEAKQFGSSARDFERQAVQVREQSFLTAIDIADQGDDVLAVQTTAFGKSGSALEGSPLSVLADTANEIDTNIERAIEHGRIQYAAYMAQARKMKRAEKNSRRAGIVLGVSTAFAVGGMLVGGPLGAVSAMVAAGNAAAAKK